VLTIIKANIVKKLKELEMTDIFGALLDMKLAFDID
jgi:hypothetical protein